MKQQYSIMGVLPSIKIIWTKCTPIWKKPVPYKISTDSALKTLEAFHIYITSCSVLQPLSIFLHNPSGCGIWYDTIEYVVRWKD